MPAIAPTRLLEQADHLGGRNAGVGRPRDVDLRRAASAAYYAVFHGLGAALVGWLAPSQSRTDQLDLRRAITHGGIKDVCSWVANTGQPELEALFILIVLDGRERS